ncbi:MAG: hypothetical protein ACLRY4_15110 [Blautia sp.]
MKLHRVLAKASKKAKKAERTWKKVKKIPRRTPRLKVKKLPGGIRALYVGNKCLGCLYRNRKKLGSCTRGVTHLMAKRVKR